MCENGRESDLKLASSTDGAALKRKTKKSQKTGN